ncbi:MAG TPA: Asp23/Gls24 family envelope stress response protein [Actinomycetes bacterium]|jgi:uncharacterized alkaline shock family protein YloU|nr:Asp23/Gls24 family envelope stress response protein [Actinomycetes bacterium]
MTDYDTTTGATSTSTSTPMTNETAARRSGQLSPAGDTLGGSGLQTAHGNTTIADSVVAKIAGMAAREIPGVHSMGSGTARALGAVRSRIPGQSTQTAAGQGVSVEVGETQAAVDLDLVTYYGQSIVQITDAVRANVINRIEGMTGLQVTEINITVDDLYVEGQDDDQQEQQEPRVR